LWSTRPDGKIDHILVRFVGENPQIPRPRISGEIAVSRKTYRPRRRDRSRLNIVLAFGIVATVFAFAVASGQFDRVADSLNAMYEDFRLGGA
jgi:hypothetical protein